ncbi:phospholipid-transporting ATPase 1-like [Curcuma longa]|uniref:phospholipid-transporting ATPase 1-like n=1 Tax=Curcuma longa TaxID=136217 RepID=UPI003D9F5A61
MASHSVNPPEDSAAAAAPNAVPPRRRSLSFRSRAERSSSETLSVEIMERSRSRPMASYPSKRSDSEKVGSQREIDDEEARFVYINDPERSNLAVRLPGNAIKTTKYSILTFLPRNLFEQFHRVAYIYFLILAGLNQVPQLGVFSPAASILPLAFVLGVTAVKDAYEDWRRSRSDRNENNRAAWVLVPGERDFRPKPWKYIRVGEVIKVAADESIPCDIVLLATSDAAGVAYVQTINLDGESNLKTRYAKQETQSTAPEALSGLIRCEKPNRNIYGFLASVNVDFPAGTGATRPVSLGPSNIILRGCELKNTSWVVGVAVYTGQDTKVMLNSSGAPSKRSRLESQMNREVIFLAAALFALCSIVAILAGVWLVDHRHELDTLPYYRKQDFSERQVGKYNYYGIGAETVFAFLMSVILFQVMIPIALYISMELVRLGQAFFMIQDKNMFDETTKARFQCRALNINEDLGQIKYVFSDKTGTLTENKMEFRCASVRGVDYSHGEAESLFISVSDGETRKPKTSVKIDPELMDVIKGGKGVEKANLARDFFLALATCNTVVPILVETPDPSVKLIDYQGESPDEQALVYAAAAYGFMLVERTSGHIVVDVLGERQRFNVLGLHEFDSDRKRMSVVIGFPDKTIKLFVKGADNSMYGVIQKNIDLDIIRETETNLHAYSSMGLRTLVIGIREFSIDAFEEWHSAYEKASQSLIGRAKLLRAVAANVERDLNILGASGIEDKLQQGVPEAIESLRQAGIKVWVLTGDKQETAISIGFSCKLLTRDMNQIVINSNSKEACRKSLQDAASTSRHHKAAPDSESTFLGTGSMQSPLALIIDGTSLVHILDTELEDELFEVATVCDVVLCCRVAPMQKAGIVTLIKNRTDDMTLAIGDGANDVSMIQMADVGIGISGQEGRQAVMASDFAMGQFRFLVPLLLVHGHWNYQRMAYMIMYNFYRNSVFVFLLFWNVLYTSYSLLSAINEWNSVLYSVIYTALPTIIVGILDQDVSRKTLLKYPKLYKAGQNNERYNLKLFVLTMTDSLWQSLTVFYIPYLAYRRSTIDGPSLGDLLILAVVFVVNIHLAMDVFQWNWITHASLWGCIVATIICVIVIDCIWMLPGYWAIFHIMGTRLFWACLFGILVASMVPRFTTKALTERLMPSDVQIARELEKSEETNLSNSSEIPLSTFSQL